MIKNRSIE